METATQPTPSTELTIQIPEKAQALVLFTGGLDATLKHIADQARAIPRDISTPKGRKLIASTAYKVAQSKTALDGLGKDLVAGEKAKLAAIDAERARARKFLDDLNEEIRKPLTDFEEAEATRIKCHEEFISSVTFPYDPQSIADADAALAAIELVRSRDWQEFKFRADQVMEESTRRIVAAKVRLIKAAQDAAELARLRADAEARERQDRERKIAEEAAAQAKAEAEERAAAARAESERIAHDERLRVEREKKEAAEKAEKERQRLEREKAEADARAKKAEDDKAAAAKKAKADQDAAVQRERDRADAEAKKKADAEAKRKADDAHREKIHAELLADMLKACNVLPTSDLAVIAQDIAQALIAGRIRHTRVIY